MSNSNSASTVLTVLSFFFPIVGWVLYFVKKDENLEVAKTYAKWAWIGFGIGLVLNVLAMA